MNSNCFQSSVGHASKGRRDFSVDFAMRDALTSLMVVMISTLILIGHRNQGDDLFFTMVILPFPLCIE